MSCEHFLFQGGPWDGRMVPNREIDAERLPPPLIASLTDDASYQLTSNIEALPDGTTACVYTPDTP